MERFNGWLLHGKSQKGNINLLSSIVMNTKTLILSAVLILPACGLILFYRLESGGLRSHSETTNHYLSLGKYYQNNDREEPKTEAKKKP